MSSTWNKSRSFRPWLVCSNQLLTILFISIKLIGGVNSPAGQLSDIVIEGDFNNAEKIMLVLVTYQMIIVR